MTLPLVTASLSLGHVPILPELAQELRTHLGDRANGYLFETIHFNRFSPRRIQQIIKDTCHPQRMCLMCLWARPFVARWRSEWAWKPLINRCCPQP
jgi:hypothetical protein